MDRTPIGWLSGNIQIFFGSNPNRFAIGIVIKLVQLLQGIDDYNSSDPTNAKQSSIKKLYVA